jgi:hypothetical protein
MVGCVQEWSEWFSSDVMETPLRDIPETKQSFLPSYWEKKKVLYSFSPFFLESQRFSGCATGLEK